MPDLYVLDTSAIAAFTDQEEGAAEVERLLDAARRDECQVEACAISLMELYVTAGKACPQRPRISDARSR